MTLKPRSDGRSWAEWLASRPVTERREWLAGLSEAEAQALRYEWPFWARPSQVPPASHPRYWGVMTGRGWGKTRVGGEWVRDKATNPQARIALISDTFADVRDVMIEGPSGILAVCPPWSKPVYEPSKRRVVWPNGALAIAYAAESPDLLRGPEHTHGWLDEVSKWKNLHKRDQEGGTAWSNFQFGLRVGDNPSAILTFTPRPIPLVRWLLAQAEDGDGTVVITRGTSAENRSNLAPQWFAEIVNQYEGTRLGRQELSGEVLTDTPGALWTTAMVEQAHVEAAPELERIVLAIDPPGSDRAEAAECGMVAAGRGVDGHAYVLHDLSGHATPSGWGAKAVEHYGLLRADRIVAETNYGGQMVEHVVQTAASDTGTFVAYRAVTATRGKQIRAEPIAALYEQRRVHHVGGFAKLEDELTTWAPGLKSPNRLDALVWALTDLMLGQAAPLEIWGGDMAASAEDAQAHHDRAVREAAEESAREIAEACRTSGCWWPGGQ